ncbi:MAG: c-type cytochrome biogenesis protein CcmI [Rhizobiales bacterium]|nr:c-type cytochrome biogenesis protein CcmI [Hyphomicrobiales bacterium]
MTLWIGIVLLTFGAAALALRPLFRRPVEQTSLDHAIRFYETRRAEMRRQAEAGLISLAECEAFEAEQARRLLVIGRQSDGGRDVSLDRSMQRKKIAALFLLAGLPLFAIPLYLKVGRPGMPDQPLAARISEPRTMQLADALARIEAHLAKNPNDAKGFEVVAPVYLQSGRFDDATFAYRRVIALSGETPDRLADLGEALVAGQNGVVNADAKAAFRRAIEIDPTFAKARFYVAIAAEQDGDVEGAVRQLIALSASLEEGPGKMRVEAELDRFRAEGKAPPRTSQQGSTGQAITALPPEQRARAIEGMVEGLAERLRSKGGSFDEWQRLVQARMVLEQGDKAREALDEARRALAGNAAALAGLDRLAERLGLTPAGSAKP